MADEVLDVDWADVTPGMTIRWISPSFVRKGKVLKKRGISLQGEFDYAGIITIPNAKQYFDNISPKNAILVIADDSKPRVRHAAVEISGDMVTPIQAAEILGTDSKTIRRRLRSGSLPAIKKGGSWLINKSDLGVDND